MILAHRYQSGDSNAPLSKTSLLRASKLVAKFAQTEFGMAFKDLGDALPHGRQRDSFSCGAYVENTVSSRIFGDALLDHSDRRLWRMKTFLQISKAHSMMVSRNIDELHSQLNDTCAPPDDGKGRKLQPVLLPGYFCALCPGCFTPGRPQFSRHV